MQGLISIAQMRKRLRESGRGDFLPASLHELVHNIGKYNKIRGHYYHIDAFDFIFREDNFQKLKEIDKHKKSYMFGNENEPESNLNFKSTTEDEDEIEMPRDYYEDMIKSSQECLDNDEVDYARYNNNESMVSKIKKNDFDFNKIADETAFKFDYEKEIVYLLKKYIPFGFIDCTSKDIFRPSFYSDSVEWRLFYVEIVNNDKIEIIFQSVKNLSHIIECGMDDCYIEQKEIYSFVVRYLIAKGAIDVSKMRF